MTQHNPPKTRSAPGSNAGKQAATVAALEAAGPSGLDVNDIPAAAGLLPHEVGSALQELNRKRLIAFVPTPSPRAPWRRRYYALQHAPENAQRSGDTPRPKRGGTVHGTAQGQDRAAPIRRANAIAGPEFIRAQAIHPPGVQVQRAPEPRDRFAPEPGERSHVFGQLPPGQYVDDHDAPRWAAYATGAANAKAKRPARRRAPKQAAAAA